MKLRIKGNSIRLRLLRSEVEKFAADGRISDQISFGRNSLTYSMQVSREAASITAHFEDAEIVVVIPESAAREWAGGDSVGFDVEHDIGDGTLLTIVIEKDFECIDRPDDPDRADAYPNPLLSCAPTNGQ